MGSIRHNISNGGFRSDGPIWEDVLGSSDEQQHVVGTDGDCSIQGWKRVRPVFDTVFNPSVDFYVRGKQRYFRLNPLGGKCEMSA